MPATSAIAASVQREIREPLGQWPAEEHLPRDEREHPEWPVVGHRDRVVMAGRAPHVLCDEADRLPDRGVVRDHVKSSQTQPPRSDGA
jgi:hypothetical protein